MPTTRSLSARVGVIMLTPSQARPAPSSHRLVGHHSLSFMVHTARRKCATENPGGLMPTDE